ncbi:MAG: sel1 repeat family protein [Rhodocyclaceae bacterium]|nr:sel1 repeat family protein [Rhodocyclaceae bacterium]
MNSSLTLIAAILLGPIAILSTPAGEGNSRGAPMPSSTMDLLQSRRYADAYPSVSKLASSGNQQAQFILANYYICGRVVEFSCSRALALFKSATKPSSGDQSAEIVRRSKNEIAWINAACEESGFARDTNLAMKYAMEAANQGDPYSIDSVAAVQARIGNFRAAVATQRDAIAGLTGYARDNPVDSYTIAEFHARLKRYESNQPSRFGKWNADQNCNALPNGE